MSLTPGQVKLLVESGLLEVQTVIGFIAVAMA
jgi:hypothetical protein